MLTPATVAQQITKFEPDLSYAPENASDFFSHAGTQKWLDLVPSKEPPR